MPMNLNSEDMGSMLPSNMPPLSDSGDNEGHLSHPDHPDNIDGKSPPQVFFLFHISKWTHTRFTLLLFFDMMKKKSNVTLRYKPRAHFVPVPVLSLSLSLSTSMNTTLSTSLSVCTLSSLMKVLFLLRFFFSRKKCHPFPPFSQRSRKSQFWQLIPDPVLPDFFPDLFIFSSFPFSIHSFFVFSIVSLFFMFPSQNYTKLWIDYLTFFFGKIKTKKSVQILISHSSHSFGF